ncbi:lipopolysaccharide biosynthesis protein [Rhodocytophaga rosea]|uniref:Lipopolysaccharide biosynthesis protein n=1 Tax=Rhodocytophaga rosea TaxID=2704465 RepID=A0A6C0GPN4_9BACT|nr:lipopolysaccharide biosynthesis protein [Rhodocytophaga rosea]QHT69804.1 lipopolysaccharide biosynthesis protein [Rhodocytophaga rosea]
MATNLGDAAIRGLKWTTFATVITTLLQVLYTSIMARLLQPEDFGVVAMASFVLRFGGYFAQMGIGQALIQKKEISSHDIRVAFTSTFFLGILFSGLFYVLAPFSTLVFANPKIISVVRVMSISFFLSGLSSTSMNLLRKKMDFKLLSIIEVCSYLFGYLSVGIILAYYGFGYWSIVMAGLAQIISSTLISYSIVRHNLLFLFKWEYYKPLLNFGGKISFISLLEFLRVHLSTLVIGRLFSAAVLGIYTRAFELISLPIYYLTTNFSKVLLPVFSVIQDDKPKLKNAFLSSIAIVGYIIIPICIGISIASEQMVLILLGSKFEAAIIVTSILALGMPFRVFNNINGIVCEATATLNVKAIFQIFYISLLTILYFILKEYELVGIAMSFIVAELFMIIAYTIITKKLLQYTVSEILQAIAPGMLTGIIAGISIYTITIFLKNHSLPLLIILSAQIVTGALCVFLSLFLKVNKLIKNEIYKRLANSITDTNKSFKNKLLNKALQLMS